MVSKELLEAQADDAFESWQNAHDAETEAWREWIKASDALTMMRAEQDAKGSEE